MRVKTIHAPTMPEALRKVRTLMGDEAIMVSSRKTAKGVEVVAAAEPQMMPKLSQPKKVPLDHTALLSSYGETRQDVESTLEIINRVCYACDHHRIPHVLRDRWLDNIRNLSEDQAGALDKSLEEMAPLRRKWLERLDSDQPIILIGPPGAGKTVTMAKLAANLLALGRPIKAITCDTVKAGAIEQTASYFKAMRQKLHIARTRMDLREFTELKKADEIVLIDTPGLNIYRDIERDRMRHVLALLKAEPTLVLPVHLDAMAAAELAYRYSSFNAKSLLMTQLDTTRHFGSLLTAPIGGDMELVGLADGPEIGRKIHSMTHQKLSTLLQYTPGEEAYA